MTNLYYVGFNGYNQCPKTKFDLPKVIGNWTCIPFQEILNVSCTHRFIIIETKEKFLAFGKVTIGEVSQVIDKPTLTECFNSCDDYLLASENLNLWKYIYKESKWEKLKVKFATDQEEIIWKEADNKILKITFRLDISDVILLLKNGSVWLMSSECKVELLFPHDVDKGIDLVSGLEHTLILTESGCVLSFGNGSRGQLGNGNLNSTHRPVQISTLEGLKITKIAAGNWHSCAVTDSGDLCTWGWNNYGQLSAFEDGEEVGLTAFPVFVDVGPDEENEVIDVSCGSRHTVAKLANGDLYATGWNAYRQLGIETSEEKISKFSKSEVTETQTKRLFTGPWYTILLENKPATDCQVFDFSAPTHSDHSDQSQS